MMNALTSTTLRSTLTAIGLHVLFVVLGSVAIYQNSFETLELTGNSGGKRISLSGLNIISQKKSTSASRPSTEKNPTVRPEVSVTPALAATTTATSSTQTVATGTSTGTQEESSGGSSGSGNGSGTGVGSGQDFDHGQLFGQIKGFFESRLGSTLNIRENQLIKIKVTLSRDGEILDATLVQGKLEMSTLRRVLSVAKNIPLKSFWKGSTYPQELIIPLILTPS